ncbi:Uu.00g031060.m01.CDS01 [Anthostomella pinea]|uniref:Uu.00g031060.m01.CDS01 n=1 Tax=Anthostomella pinea TaxID=933095 RepID=A0AAI8YD64_9PEZI|nr:Uu.00g031060.m01.CDS01 [Anthostomella pinea]
MAEAIVTLNLVCNVMQVISLTGKVIGLCRKSFKDGSLELGLALNTAYFTALLTSVQGDLCHFDPVCLNTDVRPANEQDSATQHARASLRSIAADLVRDTRELQAVLQTVVVTPSSGTRRRIVIAFNYKFSYKEKISALEKNIKTAQGVMETEFLTRICHFTKVQFTSTFAAIVSLLAVTAQATPAPRADSPEIAARANAKLNQYPNDDCKDNSGGNTPTYHASPPARKCYTIDTTSKSFYFGLGPLSQTWAYSEAGCNGLCKNLGGSGGCQGINVTVSEQFEKILSVMMDQTPLAV